MELVVINWTGSIRRFIGAMLGVGPKFVGTLQAPHRGKVAYAEQVMFDRSQA